MNLQLEILEIRDVQFSDKTMVSEGVLKISRSELQDLLEADGRLERVDIELARPGESCRIVQVCDVVEPRAKMGEENGDFPGALNDPVTAGTGRTCVLRGAAVVTSLYTKAVEGAGARDPNGEIIDMTGPVPRLSVFGTTHNIVLIPRPAPGVSQQDYMMAAKTLALKASVYLARAGRGLTPDEIEAYDLDLSSAPPADTLPKVAYIFQVMATQKGTISHEPILYGRNIDKMVPTVLHPNEVLDGAVVSPFRAWGMDTYSIQNNPVIKGLYRRHGKDLRFCGVIATMASDNNHDNKRSATIAANLAKWVLGVDGVIMTKSGGGAPEVPMALIAQRCEQMGVKTTLALWHIPVDVNDATSGVLVFNMPELDAIVSMGTPWAKVLLPPVERLIGTPASAPNGGAIEGEIERELRWIRGAQDQLGPGRTTGVLY